jgi:hypothetical protein
VQVSSLWRAVIVAVLAVLAVVVWLVTQSGATVASQTRAVAPFNAVELAGANVVTVHVGAPQSVVVHARQSELQLITTDVRAGTLVIANVPTRQPTKGPMSVSITVPSMQSLAISGSGVVNLTGIHAPSFTVTIGGSGVVNASGTATRLSVSMPGSGYAELGQLVARDVSATVSGDGQIVVTATRSLDASVPGTGVIRYSGNPAQLTTSVTGTGTIIPG